MAVQLLGLRTKFTDDQGRPLVGGKVHTFYAGTCHPKDTYKDPAKKIPNTNPVILDDTGSADIFLDGSYLIRICDKNCRIIEEQDNVRQPVGLSDFEQLGFEISQEVNNAKLDLEKIKEKTLIVESIADLSTIKNPKDGLRVYVKSSSSNFIFKQSANEEPNGGTVVTGYNGDGIWEMEDKSEYLASWFATANVEDTQIAGLQAGLDYATRKGKPFIIDDVFWINSRQLMHDNYRGLLVRTKTILKFTSKGQLRLLPQSSSMYAMIYCGDCTDFEIWNANLVGDRRTHTGTGGEWGHGLSIGRGAKNGYVHRPVCVDMWGDGLSLHVSGDNANENMPKNITVFEPVIDRVRRNGITFAAFNDCKIIRPTISNIGDVDGIVGTAPKTGIDVELHGASNQPSTNDAFKGLIESPVISNCSDSGIQIGAYPTLSKLELHIKGVTYISKATTPIAVRVTGEEAEGFIEFDHIKLQGSYYLALALATHADSKLPLSIKKLESFKAISIDFFKYSSLGDSPLGNVKISETIVNGDRRGRVYINTPSTTKDNSGDGPLLGKNFLVKNVSIGTEIDIGAFDESSGKESLGAVPYTNSTSSHDVSYMSNEDTYFGGVSYYNKNANTISRGFANSVIVNTALRKTGVYLNTSNDYRVLNIAMAQTPINKETHEGLILQGVKILSEDDPTVYYSQYQTQDPNAFIKLRNTRDGYTKILEQHGKWIGKIPITIQEL